VKHRNKIILQVQLNDMALLGSNYRQVQEKVITIIKKLATDSSFDNSGGTAI
jgi:hypothetical protein